MKELKYLGVDQDRNMDDLGKEAVRDLVKKYKKEKISFLRVGNKRGMDRNGNFLCCHS